MYSCFCGIECASGASLSQHLATAHSSNFAICCEICKKSFKTAHALIEHKQKHFRSPTFSCWKCFRRYQSKRRRNEHAANCQIGSGHSNRIGTPSTDFVLTSSALENSAKVYAFNFPDNFVDIDKIDKLIFENASQLIRAELEQRSIKTNFVITVQFYKAAEPDVFTEPAIFFRSDPLTLFQGTSTKELLVELRRVIHNFRALIEEFQVRGSGWCIKSLDRLEIEIIHADYFKSTGSFIELPPALKNKRCLLNIVTDIHCFQFCLIAFRDIQNNQLDVRNPRDAFNYRHRSHEVNLQGELLFSCLHILFLFLTQ
jgi:hypothetical protein